MHGESSSSQGYQKSDSAPLTPSEMQAYYAKLDEISGGKVSKQVAQGTPQTPYTSLSADLTYKPVSDAQLRNLGGAGATRQLALQQGRQQALDQVAANPALTIYQRQRSDQLTNRDFTQQGDAVNKEVEAALTNAALSQASSEQQGRQDQANFQAQQALQDYMARASNNALGSKDIAMLADIFMAAKGQKSSSMGQQSSSSSGGGVL